MSGLQGVILRVQGRGFIVAAQGQEHHYAPRHARRQAWFRQLPADDRACVDAWLRTWAVQERQRREVRRHEMGKAGQIERCRPPEAT
ncbi:hypothetical protein [Pseudorhodoferax sp. Leaf274]|uniref:hypothetical protein n=1 Tax=Pseudorhodoferax sp. Leaf274 TaxID=1736318 RepID=UPI0007032CA6|nr:hypothetical protein [Pseudorhodoferax sp. Leaf274]KQP43517.1 hypothetical protein ASF44_29765 [Pseudorhodoferax sp. Leaf274]